MSPTFSFIFSLLSLGGGLMLLTRLRMPFGMAILPLRSLAVALAPFQVLLGLLGLLFGALAGAALPAILGALGAVLSAVHVARILAVHADFQAAFGPAWQQKLPSNLASRMLPHRWVGFLPKGKQPCWDRNVSFWTIPGTPRALLCDLWQPPDDIPPTGLAFIYFHGSDWYLLDKDFGTRTLFRHLANQGHVVMDVAYRLFPETDMAGMVGDVRRAVVWMKQNAARLRVDPQHIVIGGASAGGHLSLLSAFAGDTPGLTPPDLASADFSVRGVISIYGPTDLAACYYKTNQDKTTRNTSPAIDPAILSPATPPKRKGMHRLGFDKPSDTGAFVKILGGHPPDLPEKYTFYSPVTYVHPACPPTLILQGESDLIVPVDAVRVLIGKLAAAGVPVASAFYPQADHAFDLFLPRFSVCSQAALYEIDRFLALMA